MAALRYDPYDRAIDSDPYPTFRRLRDEAPLYLNEEHGFYALSRYADVRAASLEWQTYISGRGTLLEIIKSGMEVPPGLILFEDPPEHDRHRSLLARVFTPRRIAEIEPKVRAYCARTLDPLVGTGSFDFIADLGAEVPMRTIGMMLGIPEADQSGLRDRLDASMQVEDGTAGRPVDLDDMLFGAQFHDYVEWRSTHPGDDLMTDLLAAEYDDGSGRRRRLERDTIANYVALLAGAGAETTTRLIGWAGKVLAEHPDQRAALARDHGLIPGALDELLRFESPSPVQARVVTRDVEHHGTTVAEGSIMLLITASANRDERQFADPDRFDITRTGSGHVAFGHGIHFCLGSHLAKLGARVALEEVLTRWPTWEVDWEHAVQAHTSTVRGWQSLPVFTDN